MCLCCMHGSGVLRYQLSIRMTRRLDILLQPEYRMDVTNHINSYELGSEAACRRRDCVLRCGPFRENQSQFHYIPIPWKN